MALVSITASEKPTGGFSIFVAMDNVSLLSNERGKGECWKGKRAQVKGGRVLQQQCHLDIFSHSEYPSLTLLELVLLPSVGISA